MTWNTVARYGTVLLLAIALCGVGAAAENGTQVVHVTVHYHTGDVWMEGGVITSGYPSDPLEPGTHRLELKDAENNTLHTHHFVVEALRSQDEISESRDTIAVPYKEDGTYLELYNRSDDRLDMLRLKEPDVVGVEVDPNRTQEQNQSTDDPETGDPETDGSGLPVQWILWGILFLIVAGIIGYVLYMQEIEGESVLK